MDKTIILQKVAPCSLMCHTCSAYGEGVICESATTLSQYLDGMKEFMQKHMPDAVDRYAEFEKILGFYSAGPCGGCRSKKNNRCSINGCFLLNCTKEHGVDFCGECVEFPCGKTGTLFEAEVYKQWLSGNQEIREKGIEAFWEGNSKKPHYRAYKE